MKIDKMIDKASWKMVLGAVGMCSILSCICGNWEIAGWQALVGWCLILWMSKHKGLNHLLTMAFWVPYMVYNVCSLCVKGKMTAGYWVAYGVIFGLWVLLTWFARKDILDVFGAEKKEEAPKNDVMNMDDVSSVDDDEEETHKHKKAE